MISVKNKLSTILNLSNQANLCDSQKTNLSQFNFILMVGLESISNINSTGGRNKIPLSVNITKSGEIEINGIDECALNNKKNIRIYSDKKITQSEE